MAVCRGVKGPYVQVPDYDMNVTNYTRRGLVTTSVCRWDSRRKQPKNRGVGILEDLLLGLNLGAAFMRHNTPAVPVLFEGAEFFKPAPHSPRVSSLPWHTQRNVSPDHYDHREAGEMRSLTLRGWSRSSVWGKQRWAASRGV